VLEAYPRSVRDSGLLEKNTLGQEVSKSSTEEIILNEKDQLLQMLHWNNCLINAIKRAAFGKNVLVSEQELLRIRLRIGQLGTMLVASPRTISIICEELKIQRGVVVVYQEGPSEDFGDTANNPVMILHTGAAHFIPWDPSSSQQITSFGKQERLLNIGEFLSLTVLKHFELQFKFDLEDLINDIHVPNNLFFALQQFLPRGSFLALDVEIADEETGKETNQSFLFEGVGSQPSTQALTGGGGGSQFGNQLIAFPPSRKKKRGNDQLSPRKRAKKVTVVFVPPPQQLQLPPHPQQQPQQQPFAFPFVFNAPFTFNFDFSKSFK
jgi:hypothetical protein